MIDEARTLELFGYTSDSLTYGSGKKVCAVCDECGKVRLVRRLDYRDICHRCNMHSDERNKRISETVKRYYENNRNSRYGTKLPKEHRMKIRESNKGRINSLESIKKQSESLKKYYIHNIGVRSGSNNPNWQGGISFEPYCPKFNEAFKESIREKFGRVCFLCPKTEVENGKKLSVHHVDYDKNCLCDGVKCEFVPLCASCHSKTNNEREYWENLIMEKLKDSSQLLDQFSNE